MEKDRKPRRRGHYETSPDGARTFVRPGPRDDHSRMVVKRTSGDVLFTSANLPPITPPGEMTFDDLSENDKTRFYARLRMLRKRGKITINEIKSATGREDSMGTSRTEVIPVTSIENDGPGEIVDKSPKPQ